MGRGDRRRGREAALKLLYQIDLTGDSSPAAIDLFWQNQSEKQAAEEAKVFADDLVARVLERKAELDAIIDGAAEHWDIERFSRVDLNLIRLAVCELVSFPEVPGRVVVNEAVEIARRFSDGKSAAFINGVLDHIARARGRFEEA